MGDDRRARYVRQVQRMTKQSNENTSTAYAANAQLGFATEDDKAAVELFVNFEKRQVSGAKDLSRTSSWNVAANFACKGSAFRWRNVSELRGRGRLQLIARSFLEGQHKPRGANLIKPINLTQPGQ